VVLLYYNYIDSCDIEVDGDFGQTIADGDTATFAGSGTLYGWLFDAPGVNQRWADAATIIFERDAVVSFNLFRPAPSFDARLTFGALGPIDVTDSSVIDLGFVAAGSIVNFILDPTVPTNSLTRDDSAYQLTVTSNVAAVPIPATGWLFIGGLGALVVMRRKASAIFAGEKTSWFSPIFPAYRGQKSRGR
jgi:hypothetical protein